MCRPAGTRNDVFSNALHHHCVHPMDVSTYPQTHLKEEWGHDVTLIEDGTLLVGVPVHKISSWSSQIAILSSIPSCIRYQRLMTNLLNSASLSSGPPGARSNDSGEPFLFLHCFKRSEQCEHESGSWERVDHAMYTLTSPITQRYII